MPLFSCIDYYYILNTVSLRPQVRANKHLPKRALQNLLHHSAVDTVYQTNPIIQLIFFVIERPVMLLQLLVLLSLLPLAFSASVAQSEEECQKRVPSSFTAAQKKLLCSPIPDRPQVSTIGPAICASVAKQLLHGTVKFESILLLCQGASSAAPVQCYNKLESVGSSLKAKYGVDLCARVENTLPGECFAEVYAYSGTNNKLKPDSLMSFCKSLEDRAPLLCLHAVRDTSMLPLSQALELCGEVVGSGTTSSTDENSSVARCIKQMHDQVSIAQVLLLFHLRTCYIFDHFCRSSPASGSILRIF